MNTVALSAEHLFKTYGEGDTAVHALNDVSFSMNVGRLWPCSVLPVQVNQHC